MKIYTLLEGDDAAAFMRRLLGEGGVAVPREAIMAYSHLLHLCDTAVSQHGYSVQITSNNPHFDYLNKRLMIPAVNAPTDYITALHEFGHAFGPRQTLHNDLCELVNTGQFPEVYINGTPEHIRASIAVVNAEIGAWEWTLDNAKLHRGGTHAAMALCSYADHAYATQDAALIAEFFGMIRRVAELR